MKMYGMTFVGILILALFAGEAQAQGTLFVEGDNVGIGTATPQTPLHVENAAGNANVLVRAATGGPASLFVIENNHGAFFRITNGNGQGSNGSWTFSSTSADNFVISSQGNPGSEFQMFPDGNLRIAGTLTEMASSRELKENVKPVDHQHVLSKLRELPIATWNYIADESETPHMGPMAEDFYELFRLSGTAKGLTNIDTTGVAFAAIQGLALELEKRDARITELESQMDELATLLEHLAGER